MRRYLFLLYAALAMLGLDGVSAADLPPARAAAAGETLLFLELVVNGQERGTIVTAHLRGDRPFVAAADLIANGVAVQQTGDVDPTTLPGLQAHYDVAGQRLLIDADPAMLPTSHIAAPAREQVHTLADTGALLNYDLYIQTGAGSIGASLWSEQRLFGPAGMASNSGTLQVRGRRAGRSYLRYDTRLRHVDERTAIALTAGDLVTQSLPWSRSVRMGGLQIARDYKVRPDLLTMPLPSFAGQTAVPTAVDLFVNGYKQQSADVAPGRFVLDNLPVVNGAGQATIVTTDAVGRQVATTIPFYVASDLLRPGLIDGGIEVGALRRGYGIRNFDYGAVAGSATLRYGLTRHLTIAGHAEGTRHLQQIGGGITGRAGLWGVLDLSAVASRSAGRTGAQITVGYSYSSPSFSVSAQHVGRSRDYRDLATFDLRSLPGTRRADRLVVTAALPRRGMVGLAFIAGRTLTGTRTRLASLSWSRAIGRFASLFIGTDHDFVSGTTSAQARLIVPFGRGSVSAGTSYDPVRGGLGQLDFQRSPASDGGLGLSASLASTARGATYGQAGVEWRARSVDLQAGGAFADRRGSAWLGATGAFVVLDRRLYAANQVSDAFAVVSTNGVPDVPISYENQKIGVTDAHGRLFVPGVTAYYAGRFGLDPLALDEGYSAPNVERHVALRAGTGAVIHMGVRRTLAVSVSLVDVDGHPLAAGGTVMRAQGRATQTGWDGLVFLDEAEPHERLDVTRRDGSHCHAEITLPAGVIPLMTLHPVPCA